MGKSFYTTADDAKLYTGSQNFAQKIGVAPHYGIDPQLVQQYAQANAVFASAYLASIDPETRTKGKVSAKNEARKSLRELASDLAKIVEGTPSVTDEQKIDLGLSVRKKPAPKPVPTAAPDIDVVSREGTNVRIRLHSGDSKRRGRPSNVSGVATFSYVGPTPPVDINEWKTEGVSGKTTLDIEFDPTLAPGTQVWFTAYWYNAHGGGPGAAPVGTVLAGGAMQKAA